MEVMHRRGETQGKLQSSTLPLQSGQPQSSGAKFCVEQWLGIACPESGRSCPRGDTVLCWGRKGEPHELSELSCRSPRQGRSGCWFVDATAHIQAAGIT